MTIIDSQVHAYEANTPKRPWHSVPNWPDHVTGDEMVAAMDKVGIDGAIFISAFSMYRYDASYAVDVQRAHPDRFAIVKPVDPNDPAVGDIIADWKQTPGAVGIRVMLTKEAKREPNDPGLDRIAGVVPVHGKGGDEDGAVDAYLVHGRHHLVTCDVIGPVRHAVPGSLRSVRLISVDLGIDDRHEEAPQLLREFGIATGRASRV